LKELAARVLLIGYGNPGRRDDGLGPALAGFVEDMGIPGVTVDSNYQLCVEDAEAVANHDVVIFADADEKGQEPFSFKRVAPKPALSFSSHVLDPPALMAMSRELFGASVEGYALGIRGYEFDHFNESLTEKAKENMALALDFLKSLLSDSSFRRPRVEGGGTALLSDEEEKWKTPKI